MDWISRVPLVRSCGLRRRRFTMKYSMSAIPPITIECAILPKRSVMFLPDAAFLSGHRVLIIEAIEFHLRRFVNTYLTSAALGTPDAGQSLSLIHISEPTRLLSIS